MKDEGQDAPERVEMVNPNSDMKSSWTGTKKRGRNNRHIRRIKDTWDNFQKIIINQKSFHDLYQYGVLLEAY